MVSMEFRTTLAGGAAALLACLCLPGTARAGEESVFTLSFSGPSLLSGAEGDVTMETYECILMQEQVPPPVDGACEDPALGPASRECKGFGAQGWSIGVASVNADIVGITTAGTAAAPVAEGGYYSGGFRNTQLTDGEDNEGAISAVVLSFTEGNVLPENRSYVVAKLEVQIALAPRSRIVRLLYVDGLQGSGQPVKNSVTQGGKTRIPAPAEFWIRTSPGGCCSAELNVGFSAERVSASGRPWDGIVDSAGLGEGYCAARGRIVAEVPPGTTGQAHVHAGIISILPRLPRPDPAFPANLGGVQGWSLSVLVSGDVTLLSATTAGTAADDTADGGYRRGGFVQTQLVDPARNGGKQGAVSVVDLSLNGKTTLPPVGTESVLDLVVQAGSLQGEEDIEGRVAFEDGLRGAASAVVNAIRQGGSARTACTLAVAEAQVVFRKRPLPPARPMIRGDANSDGKVDLSDAVRLLSSLFLGMGEIECIDTADANDNGILAGDGPTDAIYLLAYLFAGGPAPPPPFPGCGPDPTGDYLPCESYSPCQ